MNFRVFALKTASFSGAFTERTENCELEVA